MRKFHTSLLSCSLLTAALLTACASTGQNDKVYGLAALEGDPRLGKQTDRICFPRNVDGFYNTERDTVVISAGGNNDYLIDVFGICTNLRYAQSIAIDSPTACITSGDSLIVSENAFSLSDSGGIGPERCRIESIHQWDRHAKSPESESDLENDQS